MLKILYFIIAIFFLAFGLILGLFNPNSVNVDLVFLQTDLPLSILISLSVLFGIFITAIYLGSIILKLSVQKKILTKINAKQKGRTLDLNNKLIEIKSSPEQLSAPKPIKQLQEFH